MISVLNWLPHANNCWICFSTLSAEIIAIININGKINLQKIIAFKFANDLVTIWYTSLTRLEFLRPHGGIYILESVSEQRRHLAGTFLYIFVKSFKTKYDIMGKPLKTLMSCLKHFLPTWWTVKDPHKNSILAI